MIGPVAVAALTLLASSAFADARIGDVVQKQFNGAMGARGGAQTEQLVFDRDVFSAETVSTPSTGSTVLRFADSTQIQIGQNSSVVLDRFVFDPQTQLGDASIQFSKGIFRFITGTIKNKQAVGLSTPTATLGIRGTKLIIYVAGDGSTTVGVVEGAVDVKPCGGGPTVLATAGQAVQVTAACNGARQVSLVSMPSDPAVDSDYAAAAPTGTNSSAIVAQRRDGPQGKGGYRSGTSSESFSLLVPTFVESRYMIPDVVPAISHVPRRLMYQRIMMAGTGSSSGAAFVKLGKARQPYHGALKMPLRHKLRTAVAVAGLLIAQAASAAGAPPVGVYSCYDARMGFGVPGCIQTSLGCTGLVITPTPVAMFGLIDGTTYADYDGHHGHYTFDAGSEIITMSDGSRQGWRYHKIAEWSFRLIDNTTGEEHYTCPLETAKDPAHGPW